MIKVVKSVASGATLALAGLLMMPGKPLADNDHFPSAINYFDLPGQALQNSLIEFAVQANITVIADNSMIKGYRSSPIIGPYPTDKALSGLLSSTPLQFHYQPDTDTFIIQKKPETAVAPPEPALPLPSVIAPIEELLVTSVSYPFRYHTVTNSQLHGGMSYFDSARFLNVVPSALIEDQQATDLADVLKYASGITPGDGISDSNDDIFIRGFQRHAIYIDGFRLSDSTGVKQLPANVEHIEVLKGPSTLLYGQAEPGGIVNVVRKKPQDDSFVNAEIGAGSAGRRLANLDINSQLPGAGDIDFRVILADEALDSAAEISDMHRQLMALSANWNLTDETVLDIGYEYQQAEQTWERGFATLLPFEEQFEGTSLESMAKQARPDFRSEYTLFNAGLTHYFSPDWRVRAKYVWHDEHRLGVRTTSDALLHTDIFLDSEELGRDFFVLVFGGQVAVPFIMTPRLPETLFALGKVRSLYDEEAFETENNISVNLEGSFVTGSLTHHLTVGADWHQQDLFQKYTVEVRDLFPGRRWPESVFVELLPDIAATVFDPALPLGELEETALRLLYDDYGFYLQDNIELNERWIVSMGTRYSVTQGDHTDVTNWTFTPLQTYKNFSSQLGLVYKPADNHSIYMNYSEAMRANYHLDEIGPRAADPELSDQIEIGVKSQLVNGRLLSSVGLFAITKKNIVDIQRVEGVRVSQDTHEQQVRGIDMDLTWQVSSSFDLVGAFSLIDPRIVSGENRGRQPALSAEQTASLFASYRLQNGLALSGGYKYVSKRFGDDGNLFWLGEYATVDLGASYRFKDIVGKPRLQLSVKNLLDERYYSAILGGVRMNESEGRAVVASFSVEI